MISFLHMDELFQPIYWRETWLFHFYSIFLWLSLSRHYLFQLYDIPYQWTLTRSTRMVTSMKTLLVMGASFGTRTPHQGFSVFFGTYKILKAKLWAILSLEGFYIIDIWIEADSTVANHYIIEGGGPWQSRAYSNRSNTSSPPNEALFPTFTGRKATL